MKIAIVIENFDLNAGGNERSTDQIVRRLIGRGHDVTILCNRFDPRIPLPAGGHQVTASGLSTKYALGLKRFVGWAADQLKTGCYDVSLSMTTAVAADVVQPRSGTMCEALARRLAMRPSGWLREIKRLEHALNFKRRFLLQAEQRTMRDPQVRCFVAISDYVAEQLMRHYGVADHRIEHIPNAAEIEVLQDREKQLRREAVRHRHNLGADAILFFFAALHPELKGLRELLEALARVRLEQPKVHLFVAGGQWPAMRRLAAQTGVAQHVTWLGRVGSLDDYYVASDVTVLPTWSDSSSKVVLESLLHGTPAISTQHNGASRWILSPDGRKPGVSPYDPAGMAAEQNGSCAGRVIHSPADIQALTGAMLELCDPATRAACARAITDLSDCLTMDRHVDSLEVLLERVARQVRGETVPGETSDGTTGEEPKEEQAKDRKQTLLFVIEKYFEFGGLQRDMLRIAQTCAGRGHDVHVLTGDWSGPTPSGLTVHHVALRSWTNHGRIADLERAARTFVQAQPVDCVVGFKKMSGLDVYFAGDVCLAARLDNKAAAWRRLPRYRSYLANEHAVFAAEASTRILTITPTEQALYRRHYGTAEDRFVLLPPGINRQRLMDHVPSEEDRQRLRDSLGVKSDGLLFLNVGSGFHTKGIDRAITGLASLPRETRRNCVLVVVGVGKPGPFLRQAHRLGIGNQVVFTGGRSDVANFYYSADVLVHPARVEAAGHTLLEAMVCGLPVLVTANCGYAHHVSDARAGLVCPEPFGQQALNERLEQATNPEQRLQWRANALAYVSARDLYGMADRAAEAIESCARAKRGIR